MLADLNMTGIYQAFRLSSKLDSPQLIHGLGHC